MTRGASKLSITRGKAWGLTSLEFPSHTPAISRVVGTFISTSKTQKFDGLGQWLSGRAPNHWPGGLPLYLGNGIDDRAFQHRYAAERVNQGERSNQAWTYKLAKMLRDRTKFGVIILLEKLNEPDAYAYETKLIKAIGRRNAGTGPLYNLTDGGDGMISERARAVSNSPKFLAAMAMLHADPVYRAKNHTHLNKLHADPRQQELCKQWGYEQAARRRAARDAMTEEEKEARRDRKLAKWRAQWAKRRDRRNEQRRTQYREGRPWSETKQAKERQTPGGRLKRNAAERERRRRNRLQALGLLGEREDRIAPRKD
jgi:hypothetical protein